MIGSGVCSTNSAPVVNFTSDETVGVGSLSVQFQDIFVNATLWGWGGDGIIDHIMQDVVHDYDAAGTYNVSLNVSNSDGSSSETKVGYVAVVDWNPWNDLNSDGHPDGSYITISEVIYAYNCFKNGLLASVTGVNVCVSKVIGMYYAFQNSVLM